MHDQAVRETQAVRLHGMARAIVVRADLWVVEVGHLSARRHSLLVHSTYCTGGQRRVWHSPLTNKALRYKLKESDATSSKSQTTELDERCMQQRLHRVPGISLPSFCAPSQSLMPASRPITLCPSCPVHPSQLHSGQYCTTLDYRGLSQCTEVFVELHAAACA